MQNLQSLPWERKEGLRQMILQLDTMRDALDEEEERVELWPHLSKCDGIGKDQVRRFKFYNATVA